MEIWGYVLTGGVAAGVLKIIDGVIQWWLSRRATREDAEQDDITAQIAEIKAMLANIQASQERLTTGQLAVLHDRLKYLGREYTKAERISIDDRDDYDAMYRAYAAEGGNGKIKATYDKVMSLEYYC